VILLVDIGNTRTKWRCLNDRYLKIGSGEVQNQCVSDQFLEDTLCSYDIQKIYLSNVGQEDGLKVFKDYSVRCKVKLHLVASQKNMCGLLFAYEKIERLGVDRCLAMIGAYEKSAVLVIDAGSAITADYVNSKGEYFGGYIIPGYEMSRGSLLGKTARIGVMAGLGSIEPGTNTESCVNNGFALMYKSLLEGLIVFAKTVDVNRFIITGGDAPMLRSLITESIECHENLVLDGLQKYSLYYG
tara:strand:- start:726 stop:1451 length:726 start_codon:yes stop_codon:yes gene_type:complete